MDAVFAQTREDKGIRQSPREKGNAFRLNAGWQRLRIELGIESRSYRANTDSWVLPDGCARQVLQKTTVAKARH